MNTPQADDPHIEKQKARNLALAYLGRREASTGVIQTYLVGRKKIADLVAQEVINELSHQGWIDDARYARLLVRQQLDQLKGPRMIALKLRQKGIRLTSSQLNELITELTPGNSELDAAQRWALRRYPLSQTDPVQRRRAFQALLRRGFSGSIAAQALKVSATED